MGGKIAEQRPPPPGDKDPYPNLATIPPRPKAADTASWNQMTAGLITDRLNAQQAAALAPIPTAPSPSGPVSTAQLPAPAGPASSAGSQQPTASAALVGAGPPSGANQPSRVPASTGQAAGTSPVAAPSSAQAPVLQPPPPPSVRGNTGQRVANGQLPPLPTQEPERPAIAPQPPPPVVPLTAAPPRAAQPTPGQMIVDFDSGSATLNDAALAQVRQLAAARGDGGIAITGYGGATTSDVNAQSNALALGLSRAEHLATALVAQGVPFARLRLNAESAGRGATARLLE